MALQCALHPEVEDSVVLHLNIQIVQLLLSSNRKKRGKKTTGKEGIRDSNKQIWSWKKASNCRRDLEISGAKVVDASWRSAQVRVLLVGGSLALQ